MFDFGLSELLLVGVVALVVLGPERLPHAARMAGKLVGKLQNLVSNVKHELSVQAELEELRKVKQEFESAANQFRHNLQEVSNEAQSNLNQISDGLKPWERLPEQRTPSDFGIDAQGNPLPSETPNVEDVELESNDITPELRVDDNGQPIAPISATPTVQENDAWQAYLTRTTSPVTQTVHEEIRITPASMMHMDSLRKQAIQRKRDMRPKYHAKPKLRVRKK